jgi:hypothetical protein
MSLKYPFYPGKAVTTQWLNESQYFGPSAPGISFVQNPIDFWQYPLLTTDSIDVANFANAFVLKGGNITITGTKTFSTSPQVPTPTVGDSSNKAASTEFVAVAVSSAVSGGNFVDLASTQTLTGFKTFQNIAVPLVPSFPNSPISFDYADNNYVSVTGNENVGGIKIFGSSPQIPNPVGNLGAVNQQSLVASLSSLLLPDVAAGVIKLGNIQIVFGTTVINGAWVAGGPLTTGSIPYTTYAPTMDPFVSIGGGGSAIDKEVVWRSNFGLTSLSFTGDIPGGFPVPSNNGTIRWVVFGYI